MEILLPVYRVAVAGGCNCLVLRMPPVYGQRSFWGLCGPRPLLVESLRA